MSHKMDLFVAVICVLAILSLLLASNINERPLEEVLAQDDPTDPEFIRLLGPDISPEIALKVRRIIVDCGGCDMEEAWPNTTLGDLLE